MSEQILQSISDKLDKISENITEMKIIQAKHEENLKNHMHRSELLEERTDILFSELEPIKEHLAQMKGMNRLLTGLAALTTFALGVLKLLGKI